MVRKGYLDQKWRLLCGVVAGLAAEEAEPPRIPSLSSLAAMTIRQSYNAGPGEVLDLAEHEIDPDGALPPHLCTLIRHGPFICASCARIVTPSFTSVEPPALALLHRYDAEEDITLREHVRVSDANFDALHVGLSRSERLAMASFLPALPLSNALLQSECLIAGAGPWLKPGVHPAIKRGSPRAREDDIELRYCGACLLKHLSPSATDEPSTKCGCFVCAANATATRSFMPLPEPERPSQEERERQMRELLWYGY